MSNEILSRIITHPERTGLKIPNQGIALVVLNLKDQFLMTLPSSPHLEYGQSDNLWNIITGTRECGELVRATVRRELKQETGLDWEMYELIVGSYRETNGNYLAKIGYPYKFRCCKIRFLGDPDEDPNKIMTPLDSEIKQYMWGDWINFYEYPLETGAKLVLQFYGEESGLLPIHF